MSLRRRTLLALAAALIIASLVAGCQGKSSPQPAKEATPSVASATSPSSPALAPKVEAKAPAASKPAPAPVEAPKAGAAQELATYAVPKLDAIMATEMARALSPLPGVIKARPVMKESRFEIQFTPPQATPASILAVLEAHNADVSLESVKPLGDAAGHEGGCGSCPMKNVCGGKH